MRLRACLGLAVAAALTAAPPASAHLKSGVPSTDFEARIAGFEPAAPAVRARALGGDQRLELRVAAPHVVVVLGLLGEPFLRFSPSGVDANLASPTATSMGVVARADAVASPEVRWRRVRAGSRYAWHEHRLRPLGVVSTHDAGGRAVAAFSIPLLVDGRRTALTGSEWHEGRPAAWPWLLAAVPLLAGAALVSRRSSNRTRLRLAYVLTALAVGGLLAAWFGTIFAGRVSALTVAFALLFCGATALLVLAAATSARGPTRLAVMALIGALGATFAVPEVAVFAHGFVLSALPDLAERLAVALAILGGLMTAVVCAPDVGASLGLASARRAPLA